MTIPAADERPDYLTHRARREVAAVVLILLGIIGLGLTLWLVNPWLLAALCCAGVTALGVYLGIDNSGGA